MFNKEDIEKNEYSIGETAKIIGIEQHVVRFWSNTFSDYIRPTRKAGDRRYYTKADIETLFKIKDMVYNQKYSLSGVKIVLQNTSVKPVTRTTPISNTMANPMPTSGAQKLDNAKLNSLHLQVLGLRKSIENFLEEN